MNCAFKGFFDNPDSAEAAYYTLRDKQLVNDLETSELTSQHFTEMAPQIAYASEGNTMLVSPSIGSAVLPIFGGNNDPRVAMTPFLETEKKETSSQDHEDVYYLYGHCRKKDLDAISSCLKRCGASSVISSELGRPSRMHRPLS